MNIKFSNDFKYCFPVLESNVNTLIKKIDELDKEKNCIIELRLDYLFYANVPFDTIIELINEIREKHTSKKLIATNRTISEGGRVDLTKEKYFSFIKALYFNTKVNFIDVEYKFYKIDKVYYDSMFKKHKKKIILSMHLFDRIFDENEYNKVFVEMAESTGNIVKFAIKTYTKEDLFTFMMVARNAEKLFKKNKKETIFIAMGEVGKLSRVWPEFTHTKIVFLTAYGGYFDKKLGQSTRDNYIELRKILAKGPKSLAKKAKN